MPTQLDLLRGLPVAEADALVALGTRVHVPDGSVLFQLGDVADHLYIVDRGRIALSLPMQVCGREEDVRIEERSPGETLGWSALVPPHRFTLKAHGEGDSDVLAIARAALLQHLEPRPAVGYVIARNVAEIVGRRLQVYQAMWLRQMQQVVALQTQPPRAPR